MLFKDLNLKTDYLTKTNSFTFQDQEITVKEYLPVSDKIDLVQIALQKAEQDGVYNELLLDMYFHLNMVYLYTNIEFDEQDREDEYKLFDLLEGNGIIDKVVVTVGEEEYATLREMVAAMRDRNLKYQNSAAAVLRRLVQDLPRNAQAAMDIVNSFDPEKYQAVREFAEAANGGRNINTNAATTNQQTVPIQPPAPKSNDKIISLQSATKKD